MGMSNAAAIKVGDRVRMVGEKFVGTVNEVAGSYAYVSWDGGCTRKDPLSWLAPLNRE